jgi:hypothetical protein
MEMVNYYYVVCDILGSTSRDGEPDEDCFRQAEDDLLDFLPEDDSPRRIKLLNAFENFREYGFTTKIVDSILRILNTENSK